MRAQATGYAGDPNAQTATLDQLASEGVNFSNAVSCCPVCSPYRGSLMTGRYPLSTGVFVNDVWPCPSIPFISEVLTDAGYQTGYIGKWHLDGHGRTAYIPKGRRRGFEYWRALECTHNYNNSLYYADDETPLKWEGYDSIAQTKAAVDYLNGQDRNRPFALFLSWGPPHAPYETAPAKYREMYRAADLRLRPNVPAALADDARRRLAGYYAHISALDDCLKDLLDALRTKGLEEDTIVVFTSDHGDMLRSHGEPTKQRPWDESILVPFLLRYPAALGRRAREEKVPINTPDIMPTLLGLCGVSAPAGVEGRDYSSQLRRRTKIEDDGALIASYAPFHDWAKNRGGREFRGVRTERYTYARDLNGPWLLYDNKKDPYQQTNVCNAPDVASIQRHLDGLVARKLRETGDRFLPREAYLEKWGYITDKSGAVRHKP